MYENSKQVEEKLKLSDFPSCQARSEKFVDDMCGWKIVHMKQNILYQTDIS